MEGARMTTKTFAVGLALGATLLLGAVDGSATAIFSDSGPTTADIQGAVDAFRAALGDPNNGNAPGPLPGGRREINWDGGGPPVINGTAPATPFTVFRDTRGATFTTSGTGLTQAAATGGLLSLDLINPQYAALFAPFSPNRLFAPIGSNVTDGFFSIPGTNGGTTAVVQGFGAVFSDVDIAGETMIELFDLGGNSLGVFDVPATTGAQTFSFLGLLQEPGDPLIGRVRITTGTTALGPSESSTVDLVVMDDFFYGEPLAIPLPGTAALLGVGLLFVGVARLARARARR
jgi:hypothetical protein